MESSTEKKKQTVKKQAPQKQRLMARNIVMEKEVVIVGAGIAGLATAVALKRVGIDEVLVLERADELRTTGSGITFSPNAWTALDALGVSHKLTRLYKPFLKGFVTNVSSGAVQQQNFPPTDEEGRSGVRTVHRKKLLEALAQELPKDWIRYSSKLSSIDQEVGEGAALPVIHLEDGTTIRSKVLMGCDGVHSVVADWLGLAPAVHSGRSAVRGLSVFPEGHGLKQEVHQFVDEGKRAGFVPLNDNELYWFMTCQSPPQDTRMKGNPELIQRETLDNIAKDFPSLYLDVVRHANLSTLTWAPLVFRYPWRILLGNLRRENVTVAGDAMHPMTPDLGQGGSCALEDAVVLGRHIGNSFLKNGKVLVANEIPGAIDGYLKERRWRATLMVTGSYLSGWAQEGGSSWWKKFLRDSIFYKYIFPKFLGLAEYNCGKLPTVELEHSRKEE